MAEPDFPSARNEINRLIQAQDWPNAHERIRYFHRVFHQQAVHHEKLHWLWIRLCYHQHNYAGMAWQLLPLIFAVPVSWLHRITNIALPDHKIDH